jgi:hypothetical protein
MNGMELRGQIRRLRKSLAAIAEGRAPVAAPEQSKRLTLNDRRLPKIRQR